MIAVKRFPKVICPAAPVVKLYGCARQGAELRRRLSRLSYAGWLPHDRGFVLGLPRSGNEHRLHRHRLTMLPEGSPPRSTPSLVHRLIGCAGPGDPASGSRGCYRYLPCDCPDKAEHFAGDCGGNHHLRLARRDQMPMAPAHPQLPFPGDVAYCSRQPLEAIKHLPANARLHPVAPCPLNQCPSREPASGLGNPATTYARAAGMFGRREAEISH